MKKNIFQIIGLLLLLPLFSGCNDSDDVAAIFTGKTWKLTYITADGRHQMADFWDNEAERKKSMELLEKKGNYNVEFEGITDGDQIKGNIGGSVIELPLTGTWIANGKDNKFKANITDGKDGGDKLAKNFLERLRNATSYEGDQKNLYLLYKPVGSQQTYRMAFHVISN